MDTLDDDSDVIIEEEPNENLVSTPLCSRDLQNPREPRRRSDPGFNKYPDLVKFFGRRIEGKSTVTFCLACNSGWVSRSYNRLTWHIDKCKEISEEDKIMAKQMFNISAVDDTEKSNLWTKVIVENNIPIRAVETRSFREFAKKVCQGWKLPSRKKISNECIPSLSRALQSTFKTNLSKIVMPSVSIEFDHWEDANSRSYLGVIATLSTGSKYLIDLKDVSMKGHSSAVIVEELALALKDVPHQAINSIMSDSASSCKKAREDFVSKAEFMHVIQHRCLAHLLNRVGSRITSKNRSISDTLSQATRITSMISHSVYWSAYIKDQGHRKVRSSCQVRWYSNVCMIRSLLDLRAVIENRIRPELSDDKRVILDRFDWLQLDELLKVLEPISDCIASIERKDISLGEAVAVILEYGKKLFECEYSDVMNEARKSFLWHFNPDKLGEEEFGLYLAAYALDSRYKLSYLTEDSLDLVQLTSARIAAKSGVPWNKIKTDLFEDFEYYKQTGAHLILLSQPGSQSNSQAAVGDVSLLSRVSNRLACLKASSANIERTFSMVKSIQGARRINLATKTLVDIARLKVSYCESQEDELEDIPTIDEPNTSSQSEVDVSLDLSSADSSILAGCRDEPFWFDDLDSDAKRAYRSFVRYIDFACRRDCSTPVLPTVTEVTDEEIRHAIRQSRSKRLSRETETATEPPFEGRGLDRT